ncbi:hypothetical protein BYT27DRAFT_7183765 [Phlegmacium glaucopus]|nr:hypothetical protein BYT27DRAFT_7183765 [Phlegmacium glaucopus]
MTANSFASITTMLTFIIVLACNIDLMHVFSSPVGHGSNLETVHWVSPPPTRGTFNILTTCVLTLILCMWTAMHMNIPPQDESPISRMARKLMWTLIALLAPEIVAYIAWRQWISAKSLAKEINDIIDKQDSHGMPQSPQNRRWTIVHGFYAGMGGFAFKIEESFIQGRPSPLQVPLTAAGVSFLANMGHIEEIRISEESIIDKSKADSLRKALLCIQAGWFVLQCISRLATKLPVTLLEVNTVGHALCALAIYGFWFRKPLEVRSLHAISSDWAPPLCAFMWMTSTASERLWNNEQKVPFEMSYLFYSEDNLPNVEERADAPDEESVELAKGETLKGTCFVIKDVFPPPKLATSDSRTVALCREDIWRWRLASQAIKKHPNLSGFWQITDRKPAHIVVKRSVGNHDMPSLDPGGAPDIRVAFKFAFALFSGAYGGLHALKWNDFFPSWPECLLWRISCVVVVAGGATIPLLFDSSEVLISYSKSVDRSAAIQTNKAMDVLAGLLRVIACVIFVLGVFITIGYVFCRAYLVVEAFISIRELPIEAYQTPTWTQLIPHL